MSSDILETILNRRRSDVRSARETCSSEVLTEQIAALFPSPPLDLYRVVTEAEGYCIAAEFKRASPSKGAIASPDTDVATHVGAYIAGGAGLLSVLTEPHWFKGDLADMKLARELSDSAVLPGGRRPAILRKDFIVDSYQVSEARAWGADTVLLIVAALQEGELSSLIVSSRALGMEPLVEVCRYEQARADSRHP